MTASMLAAPGTTLKAESITIASAREHRTDIDGLRALAVVPVVLFHAGVPGFGGGFVGVDIFFVISGFLITGIIHREAKAGRFSIIRFYERRVRRIFPALFALLAATFVIGLWLLLPMELVALARQLGATTLFVSNILFWRRDRTRIDICFDPALR